MTFIEPPSRPTTTSTSKRSKTKTDIGHDVESDQKRLHPALTVSLSTALLLLSGYLAFAVGITTIPQAAFFAATCSIGLGGLSTLLGGTATITIGKWFRATGYIAVFMAILLIVMQALGILKKLPNVLPPFRESTNDRVIHPKLLAERHSVDASATIAVVIRRTTPGLDYIHRSA
jgi:hypothetical protein